MAGEYPRSVVANVRDCNIVRSKFELNSRSYVHNRINTPSKGINPLIARAIAALLLSNDVFGIE